MCVLSRESKNTAGTCWRQQVWKDDCTAIYGPQTSTDEDSQEVGEVTMKTVTNKWEKALANGNVTSLQVATAATGEKYDVVVLGVTCYNPEDLSEEAVE